MFAFITHIYTILLIVIHPSIGFDEEIAARNERICEICILALAELLLLLVARYPIGSACVALLVLLPDMLGCTKTRGYTIFRETSIKVIILKCKQV